MSKPKCEHMNEDGTFKGGFDGCVLHMTTCEGHSEESAKKICGKIAQNVSNRDLGDPLNRPILNRNFQHPADGWYQLEAKGEHPARDRGIIQVIDDTAIQSIVNRFNADADAGRLSHGAEMLIDHEHFKHDLDKESTAYGWLNRLQGRADGYYGRIRWTATGKPAVDGGDYRFFSTEYDARDLKVLNSEGKLKRMRPTRLDGLSLTNSPNNKGGKPITNRDQFRGASAPADNTQTPNQRKPMQTVATRLGLSADASEEAVLADVVKLMNRATQAEAQVEPLKVQVKDLGDQNQTLLGEQCDALMDGHGIKKDDKIRNRLRPILVTLKNREERVTALSEFGFKPVEAAPAREQTKLFNRQTKPPGGKVGEETPSRDETLKANKIMNRAAELRKETPTLGLATSVVMAQKEIENAG